MTQTVSGAVAVRSKQDVLVDWVRAQQAEIAMVAATHVKPSAVVRVAHGALRRNPKLMQAAIANPQSLLYALLDAARLGHEPDTDDYYLVPFGNEVQGIEGYKGVIERMYRASGVSTVVAQVVRQRDRYTSMGENTPPLHEYDDFASPAERGQLRGAYAYAIFPDGRCSQVIRMGRAEIMEHKAKSRGSSQPDSPWQQWEPAMWKKTVLRALEPYVPTSTEYRHEPRSIAAAPVPTTRPAANGHEPADIHDAEIVDETSAPAAEPAPAAGAGPAAPRQPRPRRQPHVDRGEQGINFPTAQHIAMEFKRLGIEDRNERLTYTALMAGVPDGTDLASTADLSEDTQERILADLKACADIGELRALIDRGDAPGGGEN